MKKSFFLLAVTMMSVVSLNAKTLYLNAGGSELWDQADAKFAIWHWQDENAGQWSDFMVKGADEIYVAEIADTSNKVIFVRISADAETPDWEKKWNQTDDLDLLTSGENLFTITSWGEEKSTGEWSVYGPTAINNVAVENVAVKFIENGEIRIRRGNQVYDVTGAQIR